MMEKHAADGEQKFVIGLWLRVVAAGVFLCLLAPFTALGIDFPYSKCYAAYYGLIGLLVANGLYWFIGERRGFPLSHFYFHWLVDVVLISVVIYGLGGAMLPSAITPYMLIVITSAVFISKKAAFIVASGAVVAYGGAIGAEAAGWIEPSYELAVAEFSAGMRVFSIVTPIFMAYLVAFIAGTVGDQLNSANALLVERNRELGERNEKLDRLRGELDFQSKVVAHDIRVPVTAASGALGELGRELEARGGRGEDLRLVEMAARNLSRVEDMIEALDQVREGLEWSEAWESVDLQEALESLRVEFERGLESKGITLEVMGELPTVEGLRPRLMVLFRNLMANAMRYVPGDGTGKIRIGAIDGESAWQIFVDDNGGGIAPEFHEVIFEMFRKAPQKEKSGGMGLGLALVRKVSEQHKGRVWVESDGHSGTRFWIELPKARLGRRGIV